MKEYFKQLKTNASNLINQINKDKLKDAKEHILKQNKEKLEDAKKNLDKSCN